MVELFEIDKGAISRQVHHLMELGLIDRAPDPDDGRATLLKVTDEGASRMKDVADHRRKMLDEQLGDWTEEELSAFVSELARYNASLSDH
jgi:DNA-binding MarR family transcriptional regulator